MHRTGKTKIRGFPPVAYILLALLSFVFAPSPATAQVDPVYALRQADYPVRDPVIAARGFWMAPPAGRARLGLTQYMIRVVSTGTSGPPAVLDFGLLDAPSAPRPVIYSYCGMCFDASTGFPPPEGWSELGNHGTLSSKTEFSLSYDESTSSWTWFINGQQVRFVTNSRLDAATRIVVGGVAQEGAERLHAMTHYEVEVFQKGAGWGEFRPSDAIWPEGFLANGNGAVYDPSGTVTVVDRVAGETSGNHEQGASTRRGGAGLASTATRTGHILLASGASVQLIRSEDREALTPLAALTSTVTALSAIDESSFLVGTQAGIVSVTAVDTGISNPLANLGAPITTMAVSGARAFVGTDSGTAVLARAQPEWAIEDAWESRGRIRSVAAAEGLWVVGVEDYRLGKTGGRVTILGSASRRGEILGTLDVRSSPVAIVSGDNRLWLALADGTIMELDAALPDKLEGRILTTLARGLIGLTRDDRRLYALAENGEIWAIDPDSPNVELGHVAAINRGGSLVVADSRLYLTSLTGEVVVLDSQDGNLLGQVIRWEEVGAIGDVVSNGQGLALLAGGSVLQRLDGIDSTQIRSVTLPKRSSGVRLWPGGVAVIHGLGGVRLYADEGGDEAKHIRVVGVSRDVAVTDDRAYAMVASGADGLHIVDLLSGEQPVVVANLPTPGIASSVLLMGPIALVGQLGGDILVIDISNKSEPSITATIADTSDALELSKYDEESFVAVSQAGWLYAAQVSGTIASRLAGFRVAPYALGAEAAQGEQAYIAAGGWGLLLASIHGQGVEHIGLRVNAPVIASSVTENGHVVIASGAAGAGWITKKAWLYLPYLLRGIERGAADAAEH